jgi:hypothetical protein
MGRICADFFEKEHGLGVCLKRNTDPDSYRDGFNGLGADFFWEPAWRQIGVGGIDLMGWMYFF